MLLECWQVIAERRNPGAATGHAVRFALLALFFGIAPRDAYTQLNENCVVSVLNRSVQVRSDGLWVLPNVPGNIGRVRVRATCVGNGVTRSGQSDYVTIPANGIVNVPTIVFDAASPVPTKLALTVVEPVLRALGATAQITAMATYPSGQTSDVSLGIRGTNYTSSNPSIASIDANGLVTAHASGTVIVTALNDGATALLRLSVILSGDTDGDGISDDIELANGLNPNDPVDALEDFDRDGLGNREELQLGTLIRSADTDIDTLSDGREIALGTDPVVFDTDGDGLGDGLEVETGSDPRNPNSYNLATALQFIEVNPTTVFLVVNTLIGEASRQLAVTGHLRDGRTLNLTSRSRGTNYASGNLNIASFGAVDGQVFAGADGLATVTVSNSGFSSQVSVNVRSFAPTALSFVTVPGYANNVDVAGDYAFVAAGASGLQVVDVTDRRSPAIVASLDTPGNANDVDVAGSLAYVADGAAGLQIIDVGNPLAPTLAGSFDTAGVAQGVVVRGTRVYVADGSAGLQIFDASNPASPQLLGGVDTPGTAKGVDVSGSLAVVVDGPGGIRIVDVSASSSPVLVGGLGTADARDVVVDGSVAYVADYTGSLRIVSISAPAAPQLLASTPSALGGILTDVAKAGPFVLGSDVFFVNGVPIVHVGEPTNPAVRARLDFPARDDNGTGIAADGQYVYLTAARDIQENGSAGDTRLYIGQYLELNDEAGIVPTVAITSPTAGSQQVQGTTQIVKAQADDDVAVAAVTFSVDGVPAFIDSVAPFEFIYTFPQEASTVTFGATALDFGGNQGIAAPVTVNVVPDPGTTAAGRVIDIAGNPLSAATVTCSGLTGLTAADGTFSIAGVPTLQSTIECSAAFETAEQTTLRGVSGAAIPLRNEITVIGDIFVTSCQPAPGLVSWWSGDGSAGDLTGTNHGTPRNGVTFATGKAGQAFSFDGVDDFVAIPRSPSIDAIANAITIEGWINPETAGAIFARREPFVTEGFSVFVEANGALSVQIATTATPPAGLISAPGVVVPGRFQHVAVTASTVSGLVKAYVDGREVSLAGLARPLTGSLITTSQLFVGQRQGSDNSEGAAGAARYKGLIDEFRLYSAELTSDQIRSIVALGGGRVCDSAPTITLTSPVAGTRYIQGTTVPVRAQATDDMAVTAVMFSVNGTTAFTDTLAPFEFSYTFPLDVTGVTFGATALDSRGNQGASIPVTVDVVADPGTTAVGRVVDSVGNPLGGASVNCAGVTGFTAADGSFSIAGVPTIRGNIVVSATTQVQGTTLVGRSSPVPAVAEGVTDVGDVVLHPCMPPPAGLVSWWAADGDATDSVAGNHGTLQGGAAFAAGRMDSAFRLDGQNDFVNLGNGPSLRVSSGEFTVDAWVRFAGLSGDMSVIDKMSAAGVNTDGWRLLKQVDNRFWFCLGGGSGNRCGAHSHTVFSSTTATTDTWIHVAAVKSSSAIAIYVNGALQDSRPLPAFTDTHSADLRIGSYVLEGAYFSGLVDEVELFDRALSDAEIQSLFAAGSVGKCKN